MNLTAAMLRLLAIVVLALVSTHVTGCMSHQPIQSGAYYLPDRTTHFNPAAPTKP